MRVQQLFDLTGKVAIVTGGSRGLGLQIATALGEVGARLAIAARKEAELLEAADELREQGFDCLPVVCDISKPEQIQPMVHRVREHYGRIDILFNNAGMTWGRSPEEIALAEWQRVVDTNVTGTFLCSQAVGRVLIEQGEGGRIINVASIGGLQGSDPRLMDAIAYNTTKGAVINMTRDLAVKWAQHQINVNAIAPGIFPSKMTKWTLDNKMDQVIERCPLRRPGREHELKGVTVLLASAASDYITGQVLVVDGGVTAW